MTCLVTVDPLQKMPKIQKGALKMQSLSHHWGYSGKFFGSAETSIVMMNDSMARKEALSSNPT